MLRRCVPGLAVVLLAGGALLYADDEVFVKGKDKAIKGNITAESPKELKIGTKEIIAADDVVDVVYDLSNSSIAEQIAYRAAVKLEKESLDPAKETSRKALLAEAVKKYDDILPTIKKASAKRQVEYKAAMLRVRQVQEDGAAPDSALTKLRGFVKAHPTAWQINAAYQTLGRMQTDAGDFAAAEDTYTKLSNLASLSDEARMDAKMLAIQAKIQGGKYQDAMTDVKELQKELPKGSRFQARARVAEAECLVAEANKAGKDDATKGKLFESAIDLVKGVIKESSDKYVKAVGHNTLGYCYLEQGKNKDAMWDFLWVDVVYNQDRLQHAKALYHLWDIFTKEGNAPAAQDARERLLAPEFTGSEWQKKVQKAP